MPVRPPMPDAFGVPNIYAGKCPLPHFPSNFRPSSSLVCIAWRPGDQDQAGKRRSGMLNRARHVLRAGRFACAAGGSMQGVNGTTWLAGGFATLAAGIGYVSRRQCHAV